MESEFSLFPEKLRVLVVDDDPVCVKVITQMLKQCNYEVTQVAKATEAVETLKNNPKGFDMVITDSYNDINVLSLIVKIVKNERIPVILVSGLEDNTTLIKGVLHGADEVISKPVSLAKVKNLWQHVYRRRLNVEKDEHQQQPKKTKPAQEEEEDDDETSEESSEGKAGDGSERKPKKARLRWQGSLQDKFMQAVAQLGGPNKALPKQIMEIMNVPDVSRESVASHLQKYRKQSKFKNDTNGGVRGLPSSSSSTMFNGGPNTFPPPPPPSYQSMATTTTRFGCYHNHNHRHHHPGFNGPMAHTILNSMVGRSNNTSFPAASASPWHVPKVDPGIGMIPAQPLSMLPPLPSCVPPQPSPVVPIASSSNCNNNGFARLPLLPPQSQSQSQAPPPPPASIATNSNNGFAFSGKPWEDSGLLDDNFFSMTSKMFNQDVFSELDLHPEEDRWIVGEYENGGMQILRDVHQFGDGGGAAGSSSQRYS